MTSLSLQNMSLKIVVDKAAASIRQHEGYRSKVYLDHLGNPTVGYGHLCNVGCEFSHAALEQQFTDDIAVKVDELNKHLPFDWHEKPQHVMQALIEMAFQMGIGDLLKFKKTLAHIKRDEFHLAGLEAVRSEWARQTPERAEMVAAMLSDNMGGGR